MAASLRESGKILVRSGEIGEVFSSIHFDKGLLPGKVCIGAPEMLLIFLALG
jgi:hypothetical protein